MSADDVTDPDRAAILARRRRFIALAISGLATGACKTPPQPCLNMQRPEEPQGDEAGEPDPNTTGPIVEDPGVPVEGDTGDTGETGEVEGVDTGEEPAEPNPQVCLKMAPRPHPCLMIMK